MLIGQNEILSLGTIVVNQLRVKCTLARLIGGAKGSGPFIVSVYL